MTKRAAAEPLGPSAPATWHYTWLSGTPMPDDVILQPLSRADGPFKEAWARRLREPMPPVHPSEFTGRVL